MLDLVHASRGCRFKCAPCCAEYLGGRKFRPRPVAKVIEKWSRSRTTALHRRQLAGAGQGLAARAVHGDDPAEEDLVSPTRSSTTTRSWTLAPRRAAGTSTRRSSTLPARSATASSGSRTTGSPWRARSCSAPRPGRRPACAAWFRVPAGDRAERSPSSRSWTPFPALAGPRPDGARGRILTNDLSKYTATRSSSAPSR